MSTSNRRISFHVGVKAYDPAYKEAKTLLSAADDAREMYNLARDLGYTGLDLKPADPWDGISPAPANVLIDKDANYNAVVDLFRNAATLLKGEGDSCFITFSGHGTQLEIEPVAPPEDLNEAVCLFDFPMIDDVICGMLGGFRKGVDVILVLDCCHAGATSPLETAILENLVVPPQLILEENTESPFGIAKVGGKPPDAPPPLATELQAKFKSFNRLLLDANIAVFEACHDDQKTFDGKKVGDLSVYSRKFIDAVRKGATKIGDIENAIEAADPPIENCNPRLQRVGTDAFFKTSLKANPPPPKSPN